MFSSKIEELESLLKVENRIATMSLLTIIIGVAFRILGYPINYEVIFIPSILGILMIITGVISIRYMKIYLYILSSLLVLLLLYVMYYTPILIESFK